MAIRSQLSAHDRLVAKLKSIAVLSTEEIEAIRTLPLTVALIEDNADVIREGDRASRCCLVVEGFLFRYKMMRKGSRQIMSLHVSGDIPDLQSLHLDVMDHNLGALAASKVAFIPHGAILDLVSRYPGIAAAMWRDTLIDASIFREWIANLGRRPAYERIAHLMCECFTKLEVVGLTNQGQCAFPLSQAELGDAAGLSIVHVNRTLQELRADGLIVLNGKMLTILDWKALKKAAGFDRAYLHLTREDQDG